MIKKDKNNVGLFGIIIYFLVLFIIIFNIKIDKIECQIDSNHCPENLQNYLNTTMIGQRMLFEAHAQKLSPNLPEYNATLISLTKRLPGTLGVSLRETPTIYTIFDQTNQFGVNQFGFYNAKPNTKTQVIIDNLEKVLDPEKLNQLDHAFHLPIIAFLKKFSAHSIQTIDFSQSSEQVIVTTQTRSYKLLKDQLEEKADLINYLEDQAVPMSDIIDLRFDLPVIQSR